MAISLHKTSLFSNFRIGIIKQMIYLLNYMRKKLTAITFFKKNHDLNFVTVWILFLVMWSLKIGC